MKEHIAEDDLLDLVRGARALGDVPAAESHLADCAACSAVLATLAADSSVGAAGGIVLGGAEEGRPRRLWRASVDAKAPVPLTEEGLFGRGAVSPDGERVAFIAKDGRLLVMSIDEPAGMRVVPGSFVDEVVCGFRTGGEEVFVRSRTAPVRIRRVSLSTGRSIPHLEIAPPPIGLKGVDSVVLSGAGDAYAYSYGRELSRLYAMSVRRGAGAERPR